MNRRVLREKPQLETVYDESTLTSELPVIWESSKGCPTCNDRFAADKVNFWRHAFPSRAAIVCLILLVVSSVALFAQSDEFMPSSSAGAGKLEVHSKFGGQIFGFDIDQS